MSRRRRRCYVRKTPGPTKGIRRAMLAAFGLKWCRHCECWLPVAVMRAGLCREGRAADYRDRYARNPEAIRQRAHARRRGVRPLPMVGVETLAEEWGGICAYCDAPATTYDHVTPVAAGGDTTRGNVVPACLSCNSAKKDRDPEEWIERGLSVHPEPWHSFLDLRAMEVG